MTLEEVALYMQQKAKENPFDVLNEKLRPPANYAFVDVGGYPCYIQLTVDKAGLKEWWHLSVAQKRNDSDHPTSLPEHIVVVVKNQMLSRGVGTIIEAPSQLYPGVVRQFIRQANHEE